MLSPRKSKLDSSGGGGETLNFVNVVGYVYVEVSTISFSLWSLQKLDRVEHYY